MFLAGCTSTTDADTEQARTLDTEEDRYVGTVEAPEPEYDAQEAADALSAVLAGGLPSAARGYSYLQSIEDYRDSEAPPYCPNPLAFHDMAWESLTPCETPDGWNYSGFSEIVGGFQTEAEHYRLQFNLVSDFQVTRPDEETYDSAGGLSYMGQQDIHSGKYEVIDQIRGSFQVTWADDWFAENVSGITTFTGREDQSYLVLDGALSWGDTSLLFEEVKINSAECSDHAVHGVLHMRGPQNAWYVFDFGDDCDACADITFYLDTELGEGCTDFEEMVPEQIASMIAPIRWAVENAGDTGSDSGDTSGHSDDTEAPTDDTGPSKDTDASPDTGASK